MPITNNLPSRPSVAEATEAVHLATQALDTALMAGRDTRQARIDLSAAEAVLKPLEARQREADQVAASAAREAMRLAEAEAAEQTQNAFAKAVEVIEPDGGVDLPEPVAPYHVLNATRELARTQAALSEAQKPHVAAQAAHALVADRIRPKQVALATIADRRAAGDEHQDDAAQVHLLDQDLTALRAKLAPLDAQLVATAEIVAQYRALVIDAETALAAAQGKAELEAMVVRVRALEAHLVAQVRALRLEAQKRGHRNFGSVFLPSADLRNVAHGLWV